MTSFWNGSGAVVRSDGTRSGTDVWTQARDAAVNVNAPHADVHDEGLADSIEECLNINGENEMAADLAMGSNKVTGLALGTAATDGARVSQVQSGAHMWGGTSGGSANAQTLTVSPAITAYAAGQTFRFICGTTNTGAVTLNVSGVGAANLLTPRQQALKAGQLLLGSVYEATYDGTSFVLRDAASTFWPTPVATVSGTTADFTGLLGAQIKRLTLFVDGVGTDGTQDLILLLGDSGGFETADYSGGLLRQDASGNTLEANSTAFLLDNGVVAASVVRGKITLERQADGLTWGISGALMRGSTVVLQPVGFKATSGVLTQLRLTTGGTVDDFDAGSLGLLVEYF